MVVIRPATYDDALYVGARLREEDAQEVRISSHFTPTHGVVKSWETSDDCYAVFPDADSEKPAAIFGVCMARWPGWGAAWFLATPEIERVSLSLLKEIPLWLDYMARRYPEGVRALAWAKNDSHLRWAEAVGFQQAEPIEHNSEPFIPLLRPR